MKVNWELFEDVAKTLDNRMLTQTVINACVTHFSKALFNLMINPGIAGHEGDLYAHAADALAAACLFAAAVGSKKVEAQLEIIEEDFRSAIEEETGGKVN